MNERGLKEILLIATGGTIDGDYRNDGIVYPENLIFQIILKELELQTTLKLYKFV